MGKIPESDAQIRFDHAELIHPDEGVVRGLWWDAYLEAAARLAPEVLASLLTAKTIAADTQASASQRTIESSARKGFIREWCKRWGFTLGYVQNPAWNTIGEAARAIASGRAIPSAFVCRSSGYRYERFRRDSRQQLAYVRVEDPDAGDQPHPFPELAGRVRSGKAWHAVRGNGAAAMPPHMAAQMGAEVVLDLPRYFWEPTVESRAEARGRILGAIGDLLDGDLDTIEAAYRAHGYVDPPEKRQLKHVEWLVRYQLLQERKRDIADIEGTNERHVRKMINEAAAALGIELRKEKPGRPPGSRDRQPRHREKSGS